jgi:hypothetical protein
MAELVVEEIVPTGGFSENVNAVGEDGEGQNARFSLLPSVTVLGATVIVSGLSVIVATADSATALVEVTRTSTLLAVGMDTGAVYSPVAEIVPTFGESV